jgi:protein gp37
LFQEGVDDDFVGRVFTVMRRADWHIYQMLTKRAARMRQFSARLSWLQAAKHIWLGVSVEDRRYGLPRIEELRATPVGTRFLSIEPLLEHLGDLDLTGIDWVIVGGESGPGARPMHEDWVLSIRDQCRRANVPFFFKQWGGVQKGKFGRKLQGKYYNEFPKIESAPPPAPVERARRMDTLQLVRSANHG